MLTLFELLNLPIDCGLIGVPVYLDENSDGCRVWEGQEPPLTCSLMQDCIDATYIHSFLSSPLGTINISLFDTIELDIDTVALNTMVNFSWATPVLTIGNQTHNLSSLLLSSTVYWGISDPEQREDGRPLHIIGNKETLSVGNIDGMRYFMDAEPLSPTYGYLVVGLPTEFITTPLGAPSIYDYNYRSEDGMENYNPRRYVLTRYTTFAVDGESRNCGKAVRAEPQCCMQSLSLEGCMLSLEGGSSCEGRCQTIRDQINGSLTQGICNVFSQEITYTTNEICIGQPTGTPDQCINISETNNHYLLTHPGSEVDNYLLSLYNSNGELQTVVDLSFMFNQTLVYNSVPVTPQPAHPVPATVNNTICITQPSPAPDQCVDLNKVNDQEMYWNGTSLVMNSVLDPLNDCDLGCDGRILDLYDWIHSRDCSKACDCLMDSVPDRSTLITEPPTGRPAGWAAFLATNPSVFTMMNWIVARYANNYSNIGPGKITYAEYNRPCAMDIGTVDPVIPPNPGCDPCCKPDCGGGGTTINIEGDTYGPFISIWNELNEKKHHAKRWLTSDWETIQSFNAVLDGSGDVCDPLNHNVGRIITSNEFDGNYGWNPTTMPASMMTATPALMGSSAIKIINDGSYDVYMDGPIEVNHMVHAFRIAMIVMRGSDQIIVQDWKMSGDPVSGSGSVTNGYFKEKKQYYVTCFKSIELLKDDVVRLQVKIDSNVSRPRDNLDPITLGEPGDNTTLWTDSTDPTYDNHVFAATAWLNDGGSFGVSNEGVWIEYGGPPTAAYEQNFNAPGIGNPVQAWLNGFVRTDIHTRPSLSHTGCSPYCPSAHPAYSHSHSVVARLPAIAPQAPKYIHFSNSTTADWNYPGRYSPAHINPQSGYSISEQYSNTGIDANGTVKLLARAGLDESGCVVDSHYTDISDQSGFSFGVNRIKGLRPDQVEVYP